MSALNALLVLMVGIQSVQPAEEFRCTYRQKVKCEAGKCEPSPFNDQFLLIPRLETLSKASYAARGDQQNLQVRRCDAAGCLAVPVFTVRSGVFINLSGQSGGYFLKIADVEWSGQPPGEFVETGTSGLITYTWWGTCAAR